MLTNNVSQDRIIPYWDEIKKLSIEKHCRLWL